MTDDSSKINNQTDPLLQAQAQQQANQTQNSSASDGFTTGNSGNLSQVEFLTLLVEQLKNQDPLNPMDNQEFAVQLAQFSQLEELMGINQGIKDIQAAQAEPTTNVGMLASFLGHEVVLDEEVTFVKDGKGANVMLQVPEGTESVRIDITDAGGSVLDSITLEEVEAGRQIFELKDLEVEDGQYPVVAKAVNTDGEFLDLDAKITGTVEGFVMEPEPALLVEGLAIPLNLVTEVFQR